MRNLMLIFAAAAAPLAAQDAPDLFESTRTAPLTAGEWRYAAGLGGSEATFANHFSIRCDRAARRVTLRRLAPAPVPAPASALTIGTDLGTQTIGSAGVVASNDPVLDAIAFSRGRFIVSGSGWRLVLPASPEAARSIEDCRI